MHRVLHHTIYHSYDQIVTGRRSVLQQQKLQNDTRKKSKKKKAEAEQKFEVPFESLIGPGPLVDHLL